MINRRDIKEGLCVVNGSLKGVLLSVTHTHADIACVDRNGIDTLSKSSPLWRFLSAEA